MLTEPLLTSYPTLKPMQKHFIRRILWDVYREPLLDYLALKLNVDRSTHQQLLVRAGKIFLNTGQDSDGLLVQATELARQDDVDSIQKLCLFILRDQLINADTVKELLAESDTRADEESIDFAKDEVRVISDMIIAHFPELRPVIAEFGLHIRQEQQTKEFARRGPTRSGHEPLH